ncbi:MAG: NADPH-dependent 7-cyano-7-deazaguanine reductase QueF [Parachlamydiales bacterium]|jgi:7-cyano-7-deazaguanine reductase
MSYKNVLHDSPLSKSEAYPSSYDPSLLFPVARQLQREGLSLGSKLPFTGVDIWNAYEISWLDPKGKPVMAVGEFTFPCTTTNIIESKSLKLYLNSLNETRFNSLEEVVEIIRRDLTQAAGGKCIVVLKKHHAWIGTPWTHCEGTCIDDINVDIDTYKLDSNLLKVGTGSTKESLYSHLLKTNCPITNQPDWATMFVHYVGPQIDHASLLRYLISYRLHQDFHEHCAESIFTDILNHCKPSKLTVYLRYTRRGGLDINPYRTNEESLPANLRLFRQ